MLVQTAPTASNWLSVQQQLHRRSIVVFRNDSLRSTRCLVPSGFMWAEFSKCLPTLPQKEPGAAFQQQELQRDGVLSSNKKQKSQQLQSVRPLPQCLGKNHTKFWKNDENWRLTKTTQQLLKTKCSFTNRVFFCICCPHCPLQEESERNILVVDFFFFIWKSP